MKQMTEDEKIAHFKEVMGNYPTGVTVITATAPDGTPVGMTVNSFASVSLDPTLILWSIDKRVSLYDIFTNAKKFAVHVLSGDQGELCALFASRGIDRFENCEWEMSADGVPVIKGASGVLHCDLHTTVGGGDHRIIIGEVKKIDNHRKDPLLYHRRKFGAIPDSFHE
ncbi:flavin reductase (DIM6/NTAB) family NADH-FMN oxidoreductase RutF [Bhargavaea ullalensis]|uniref:Flavin reductase (DIM6/NTAB) family NADH-FMN oxidoreductase RutF n=2 Tax=Bhargavaea ullalensis TaxID=1265685 RepID=A0ABV2GD27_9BACL